MKRTLLYVLLVLFCFENNSFAQQNTADLIYKIDSLKKAGYEIVDYHAHLKGGLSIQQLLKHSKRSGIKYCVAANCGFGFLIDNDQKLGEYYRSMRKYPVYLAMQAEGREWVNIFDPDSVALFDYVFTDALTYFDQKGRRTRLWIKNEVYIEDPEIFMDYYVEQIVKIINNESFDIFVNPSFLPEIIRTDYDKLWTRERMLKVIHALRDNGIALEINARYKIPSAEFIKLALEHKIKFALGTNNGAADLGYLEYCLQMIDVCKIKPEDLWTNKK